MVSEVSSVQPRSAVLSKNLTPTSSSSMTDTDSTSVSPAPVVRSPSLHANLMRTHTNRDPKRIYEVVKVLGDGSMGSVSKVRKRDSAIGGSARPQFVQKTKQEGMNFFGKLVRSLKPRRDKSKRHSCDESDVASYCSTTSDECSRSREINGSSSLRSSMISNGHSEQYYALKSLHLMRISEPELQEELRNEVEILRELDHANIARILEVYEFKDRMYLVLELCSGGDLYARDPYSEDQAASIVYSLLSAVAYLHDKGIVHRDLKFENCLYEDSSPNAQVKLIDFGLSQKFMAEAYKQGTSLQTVAKNMLKGTVGSLHTMAPCMLMIAMAPENAYPKYGGQDERVDVWSLGGYDWRIDVWSLGVLAYMLLSSSMPFYAKDKEEMAMTIINGKLKFNGPRWRVISDDARDFVEALLTKNPRKRPNAEEALKLPWMARFTEKMDQKRFADGSKDLDHVQASMTTYADYAALKKLGLMVAAYQATTQQLGNLRDMFVMYAKKKKGEITLDEFQATLQEHYDYSARECEELFHKLDLDGSGVIRFIEFLAATIEANGSIDEERIAEAFNRIDTDDSGDISKANLASLLGGEVPDSVLTQMIAEVETKKVKINTVSYPEFLALWSADSDTKMAAAMEDVKARRARRKPTLPTTPPVLVEEHEDEYLVPISGGDDEKDDFVPEESDEYLMPIAEEEDLGTTVFKQAKMQSLRSLRSLTEVWGQPEEEKIPSSISFTGEANA